MMAASTLLKETCLVISIIRVHIPYLREMFPGKGEDILLQLNRCQSFSMKIWEEGLITSDAERIVGLQTAILSAETEKDQVHVFTPDGELTLEYESYALALDDGTRISHDELLAACMKYWDDWEEEAKKANGATAES